MIKSAYDVVVCGGGIGGSAIAAVLARGGLDVLLLEASDSYADRVRGEALTPWGVSEARRMGLLDALQGAGAHYVGHMLTYDELLPAQLVEAAPIPMDQFAEAVPGMLTLRHPLHCQALIEAAQAAGAEVRRGARATAVVAGADPSVEVEDAEGRHTIRARMIVGADGRPSAVREALHIPLQADAPRDVLGGLLVDGVDAWGDGAWSLGVEGDFCFAVFPLGGGQARVYGFWPVEQRHRFAGPNAAESFLSAFRLGCTPRLEAIASGSAAGPMLSFLNNETLAVTPFVEGAVLIGDAGGWSDPVIGCGLSSAYRDARLVSEVLLGSDNWSPAAFAGYAQERNERSRRLHFISDVITGQFCEFGDVGKARRQRWFEQSPSDPTMLSHLIANLAGPEAQPPEMFTPEHRAHLLGPV